MRVDCWATLARAAKILLILPTVLVASGGTKIVLCLLPRLQHWQHDVAIYSRYCISMAFCEKVAANLSPQSAACQCEEESSRGTDEGSWVSCVPARWTQDHSSVPLLPPLPPQSFSSGGVFPLCLQIKAIAPASVWWVEIRAISMQAHVSRSLSLQVCGCLRKREKGWMATGW